MWAGLDPLHIHRNHTPLAGFHLAREMDSRDRTAVEPKGPQKDGPIMKPIRFLIPTLTAAALSLATFAGAGSAVAQYYGPPAAQHFYGDAEQALEQRGFQDGVVGADRDFQNHRRPDVNNRDEYRDRRFNSDWAEHEYREGFRRGYYHRVREIYGEDRYR